MTRVTCTARIYSPTVASTCVLHCLICEDEAGTGSSIYSMPWLSSSTSAVRCFDDALGVAMQGVKVLEVGQLHSVVQGGGPIAVCQGPISRVGQQQPHDKGVMLLGCQMEGSPFLVRGNIHLSSSLQHQERLVSARASLKHWPLSAAAARCHASHHVRQISVLCL